MNTINRLLKSAKETVLDLASDASGRAAIALLVALALFSALVFISSASNWENRDEVYFTPETKVTDMIYVTTPQMVNGSIVMIGTWRRVYEVCGYDATHEEDVCASVSRQTYSDMEPGNAVLVIGTYKGDNALVIYSIVKTGEG